MSYRGFFSHDNGHQQEDYQSPVPDELYSNQPPSAYFHNLQFPYQHYLYLSVFQFCFLSLWHRLNAQPAQYQVDLRMEKRGEAGLDYAVVLRQNDEFRRESVGYFGGTFLGKRLAALEPDVIAAFFNVAAVRSVMARCEYHGDACRVAEVYRSGAGGDCGRGGGDADGQAGKMKPPCMSIIINAYFFMAVPFGIYSCTIIAQIEKYFNCQKRRSICFVVFV